MLKDKVINKESLGKGGVKKRLQPQFWISRDCKWLSSEFLNVWLLLLNWLDSHNSILTSILRSPVCRAFVSAGHTAQKIWMGKTGMWGGGAQHRAVEMQSRLKGSNKQRGSLHTGWQSTHTAPAAWVVCEWECPNNLRGLLFAGWLQGLGDRAILNLNKQCDILSGEFSSQFDWQRINTFEIVRLI